MKTLLHILFVLEKIFEAMLWLWLAGLLAVSVLYVITGAILRMAGI